MRRLAVLCALGVFTFSTVVAMAPQKNTCPEVIASILPKIGVDPSGSWNMAGEMGMGMGVAKIPFSHPCIETTKYPAKISLAITYYGGEMAQLLQMQGDAADQQTIQNATAGYTKAYNSLTKAPSKNPVKTENISGATIVCYDFTSECPAEGAAGRGTANRPPVPNVRLKGVARTANVRMEIELEGQITIELAKSIVKEVVENLKKTKFTA